MTDHGEDISLKKLSPTKSIGEAEKGTDDDDYDPHLHRNRPHPTTNFETLVHLLKGSLGTGILAMPQAFHNSGWLNGFISTFIIGAICTYCLHILVNAQYIMCKRMRVPMLSYPQSMKIALEQGPNSLKWFAPFSPVFIDTFLIIYQLGICCVYVMFAAENIKSVVDEHVAEKYSITTYCLFLLGPLILINCIRNLKLLAPFSTFANIITFVGIAIVIYYILQDFPSISTRAEFGSLRNYALYFGTTLFALEAVGVIIALENNMETPKDFGGYFGVLNIGMAAIIVMYALMGLLGYIKYGEKSEASVTLNLPATEILAQSVKAMFAVAIYISYGLQCFVPVEIMWSTYIEKRLEGSKLRVFWEYVLRIIVVLITFALAVSVPRLGLFISLFGCFCLSALGLAFPAIIEICVLWPDQQFGPFNYIMIKDILLIIFGIIGLVVGTWTTLVDIIRSFD